MNDATAIVDDIRRFYRQTTPIEAIARKLHLEEPVVRHAIEHGTLPEAQPQWKPIG